MIWFFLSLACALSESIKDLTGKRAFRSLDEYVCAWATVCFSIPWIAGICWYEGFGSLSASLLWLVPLAASLHTLAITLYFRAIRAADLSLVLPLVSFSPFFYLFTSPIILGEYPDTSGVLGVICIVLGSYCLNLNARKGGALEPIRLLMRSNGARAMLGAAFIWSITGNLDKIGIAAVNRFTWVLLLFTTMALLLGAIAWRHSEIPLARVVREKRSLFVLGGFHALSSVCYFFAIGLTLVAYVVSVKRLSVVFGVLWGGIMLREENAGQRFVAAALMLAGVLCITLG